ncbi:MAG: GAF domain-containing protein [Myxococcales bacterium]|nr:GAF domain-containing protein [Myxococcales bacterium]
MVQDWRIRTVLGSETQEVIVNAESWLDALAAAPLGVKPAAIAKLSCAVQADGTVVARDMTSGLEIRVTAVKVGLPPKYTMPPSSFPQRAPPAPGVVEEEEEEEASVPLVMTTDVMEMLFMELGEVSTAGGVAEASGIALRILLGHVQAGAGAVLIRTRKGDGLRFRAASGPASRKLVDTVIPLEKGIAGFVNYMGTGLVIEDVSRDGRHNSKVDRSTGYSTQALLAVPVRSEDGAIYGVVELMNPPRPFTDVDYDVAARVATSLGEMLHAVYSAH